MEDNKTHKPLPWLHFVLMKSCSQSLFILMILATEHTLVLHFLILYETCHLVVIEKNVTVQTRMIGNFFPPCCGFHTEHFKHTCLINIHYFLASNILQSTGHHWMKINSQDLVRDCWGFLSLILSCYATQTWSQFSRSLIQTICDILEWDLSVELCTKKSLRSFLEGPYEVWETEIRVLKWQGGRWWWDELGDWDWHVYTNMYKTDN